MDRAKHIELRRHLLERAEFDRRKPVVGAHLLLKSLLRDCRSSGSEWISHSDIGV